MKSYRLTEIAQLAHELSLSPLRHRLRQTVGIRRAIELLDPKREYPYSFVCFHVTGYRPRRTEDTVLGGKALISDLSQMMDALTAATPLPEAVADGRLYDVDSLAQRFNVSTKTISRWRARGLAGCWYASENGMPRFAFTSRSVQVFVFRHHELVRRGASFQLMRKGEKQRIVSRAKELVNAEGCCLHAVTLKLAAETGRAIETIRYTLRRYDRDHADEALFDRTEKPRNVDPATLIYEAHQAGESIRSLSQRFRKRAAEIRGILTGVRAARLTAQPIAYIYHPSFDAPDAQHRILATKAASRLDDAKPDELLARTPRELPAYLSALYRTPLLDRHEEQHLFRRMNFLLHQADVLRQQIADDPESATDRRLAEIEDLLEQATVVKNRIIQANLRLVVSIAKRHLHSHNASSLFELVSDGNIALMRAVEKFDFGRGFRFSTYASWAIMRSYARTVPQELVRLGRFQTGHDEFLAEAHDYRMPVETPQRAADEIRRTVTTGLSALDDRERVIVERHFGLHTGGMPNTLDEIGRELGISKERVRQIEVRAMAKLRDALGDRGAELLAG
ncbi:MAG: sigma-70 family RNA polymerase sigma factor [Planctomycetota bacterium]